VKDEEIWIETTLVEIDRFLKRGGFSCEVIFVDDGSCDRTQEILEEYQNRVDYLKVSHMQMAQAACKR